MNHRPRDEAGKDKMDHSYYRNRVSPYADNELPPQEREAVRRHLSDCEECRRLLKDMQKLQRLVEQRSQLGGEDYWERSAQKIEQRLGLAEQSEVTDITPSRRSGLVGKLAAVAASVAVLGFIALYEREISREIPTPTPPPTEEPAVTPEREAAALPQESLPARPVPQDKVVDTAIRSLKMPLGQLQTARPGAKKAAASLEGDILPRTAPDEVEEITAERAGEGLSQAAEVLKDSVDKGGETVSVVAGEKTSISAIKLDRAADSKVRAGSLEEWRHRRDSLQTLYAELISPHLALSEAKSRKTAAGPPVETVEEQLLFSYYQVAMLTPDEGERAAAIGFLSDYAGKAQSRFRQRAEKYLQELRHIDE